LLPAVRDPRRAGSRATLGLALGIGGGLALFVALTTPWHGLETPIMVVAMSGLTVFSFRWDKGRGLLALTAAASLGVAALYTCVQQVRHHYAANFVWPQQFATVSALGLAALFLLLAEAARDLLVPDLAPLTPDRADGDPIDHGRVGSGDLSVGAADDAVDDDVDPPNDPDDPGRP